jgi:hypothetical protein
LAVPTIGMAADPVQILPAAVNLEGKHARAQLLIRAGAGDDANDLTHTAHYVSSNSAVVSVSAAGQVLAVGNGTATITATIDGNAHSIPVHVTGVHDHPALSFTTDILPILSKAGCNAGACHASQYGKGGFKLSVFGFAPNEDYRAIVRDGMGRRVNFLNPSASLLLLKPTLRIPHEGGHRLQAGSVDVQILQEWLAQGAPALGAGLPTPPPTVTALRVLPARRVGPPGFTQQLQVVATYSNGTNRDVTAWAKFDSMDEGVLSVAPDGLVRTVGRGQGTAMVRFDEQAVIVPFLAPYADHADLSGWTENNFIDHLATARFRELGISPSPQCDDATFLRRAALDAIGTLPTPEEARAFLDSTDPQKRPKLIDRILGLTGDPAQDVHNNDYAAYWTLKWSDLIRANSAAIGEQGMWALHNWILDSFRENKPFDRFVRELITARGSTFSNGPANYYRIASNPQDLTEATAQLFLGIRLQCAKCHHHPYETLSQDDYYRFAAFFARVGNKRSQEFGLFGGETVILLRSGGEVHNPRTGQLMKPTPLHGQSIPESRDRRQQLAGWLTSPQNRYFAHNVVNRYVAALLGRGLVEPVDDLRATNPASNPELFDALADDFVQHGYNLKHLLRTILNSRLYQLDATPTPANAADSRFYSHYTVKRLAAEPLLDAIDAATRMPTKFDKMPLGTKAIELPDAQYNNYFLKAFGKPRREGICECERVSEPNLAQALHTLNGDLITRKIGDPKGRVARLLAARKTDDEIVQNLYLATLCRPPTADELTACRALRHEAPDVKSFAEDLLWSLLNSKHFLFIR